MISAKDAMDRLLEQKDVKLVLDDIEQKILKQIEKHSNNILYDFPEDMRNVIGVVSKHLQDLGYSVDGLYNSYPHKIHGLDISWGLSK